MTSKHHRTSQCLLHLAWYPPAESFVLHLAGGLKDVGLIQSLAKECGVQMPLGKLMLDHLKEAGDRGWTDLDWTAVTRVIREPAGIHEEE